MKITHLGYMVIPEGTTTLEVIAYGEQNGEKFTAKTVFDQGTIEAMKMFDKDEVKTSENEETYALTEKGSNLLKEIEENLYKMI